MCYINAIITGIFTVGGTLIGWHLNRISQYKNWQLQKRFENYGDFLNTLDQCNREAEKIDIKTPFYGIKSIQVYTPVRIKARTIRLLLTKEKRKIFDELVNKVTSYYSFAITHRDTKYFEKTLNKYFENFDKLCQLLEANFD